MMWWVLLAYIVCGAFAVISYRNTLKHWNGLEAVAVALMTFVMWPFFVLSLIIRACVDGNAYDD